MANEITQPVLLDTILHGVTVIPSDGETFFSALEKLVTSSSQAVSYIVHRLFLINNIGVLEVERGKKFFDVELPQSEEGDIISDINSSMQSKLIIGFNTFDIANRVVLCNSIYHKKTIRVYIDDSFDRLYLSYKITILSELLRRELVSTPLLLCDDILYKDGVTIRK